MNISDRDKRAIKFLAFTVVPGLVWLAWPSSEQTAKPAVTATVNTSVGLEQQLQRLRTKEAQIPAKQALVKDLQFQLDAREKGLIVADTLAQSQAQLAQALRATARQEGFDLRSLTIAPAAILGGEYGQISIQIGAECQIEQVVNFLADLTHRSEILATDDLRINLANPKNKSLQFSVLISGLVPKKLVPEKRPGVL
jgi:Type II secretion system (T2SS), protein M subtype b